MKQKTIKLNGMHCVSCEILLWNKFKWLRDIHIDKICHKKWKIDLKYSSEKSLEKLMTLINDAWFEIDESIWENSIKKSKKLSWEDYLHIAWISIVILILWYFLHKFNIYKYLPNMDWASFWVSLLVWLIASVSSCLAVTWWIIIWFSEFIDDSKGILWHIKVQWMFQFWRLLWFFVLWWVLWSIGQVFQISMWFTWFLSVFIWIVLVYMWLTLIWLAPSITKLWFHLPKSLTKNIFTVKNPVFAPLVWALTFFLPCWFTQTMQLLAISSWWFLSWGLIMFSFALWTSPVLFSIGLWSSYVKDKNFDFINKIVAVLVIFFWLFTITNWKNLIFIKWDNPVSPIVTEKQVSEVFEKVKIWHNWYSLDPQITKLKAWWNYEITITPYEDWYWCMSTLVMPNLEYKSYRVQKWVPITYKISNAKPWSYQAICASMGMYQGKIIIK